MNINYMSLTLFCLSHQSFSPKSTMSRFLFKEGALLHLNSSLPLKIFWCKQEKEAQICNWYLWTSCTHIWGSQRQKSRLKTADDQGCSRSHRVPAVSQHLGFLEWSSTVAMLTSVPAGCKCFRVWSNCSLTPQCSGLKGFNRQSCNTWQPDPQYCTDLFIN